MLLLIHFTSYKFHKRIFVRKIGKRKVHGLFFKWRSSRTAMEILLRDSSIFLLQTFCILCKHTTENLRNHLLSISM